MKNPETKQKFFINNKVEKFLLKKKRKHCSCIFCLKPKLHVQIQAAMTPHESNTIKIIVGYKALSLAPSFMHRKKTQQLIWIFWII